MADIVMVDSKSNVAANTVEQFYVSPVSGDGTVITAFSAINNSLANATYKAYIYDSAGVAVDPIIPLKIVVRNRFDIAPSITNQLIPNGGTLRMEASSIGAITFRVSGVEL
tara:strand:- start:378 stop:710 length:333 start_codon:yes stop_codon:yes gene_type:complete